MDFHKCFARVVEDYFAMKSWRPYRESNPGYLREREVS